MGIIDGYKRLRSEAYLKETYKASYAFVGIGGHSLANLYPVIHYLQIPLKYICVRSERKAALVQAKFPGVKAVCDLSTVLADLDVKAVLVSASPDAHFAIAKKVLLAGKALFVEKPPCRTAEELEELIAAAAEGGAPIAVAGMQKRHAPAVRMLRQRLRRGKLISYDLHYCTGAYPEGDALTELFIHPLGLVSHLFGKAEVLSCQHPSKETILLTLKHKGITGTVELSTDYSWDGAKESLSVNTTSGLYELERAEELYFTPKAGNLAGIPLEKAGLGSGSRRVIFAPDRFSPVIQGNPVYTKGFFGEIHEFAEAVEGRKADLYNGLEGLRDTYSLMKTIKTTIINN